MVDMGRRDGSESMTNQFSDVLWIAASRCQFDIQTTHSPRETTLARLVGGLVAINFIFP